MRSKALLLWIPAVLMGTMAVVEARMQAVRTHVGRVHEGAIVCKGRAMNIDIDGDGRPEQLRVVRVGENDTWVDVWHNGELRSSTKLGSWRPDADIDSRDVNGDGKMDLVRRWHESGRAYAEVWLSDGSAFDDGGPEVSYSTRVAQR